MRACVNNENIFQWETGVVTNDKKFRGRQILMLVVFLWNMIGQRSLKQLLTILCKSQDTDSAHPLFHSRLCQNKDQA